MNVAEKLAREIRRVAALREQYRSLRSLPNVNPEFALTLMDGAIEQACRAAGLDDAVAQLAATQALEAFEK